MIKLSLLKCQVQGLIESHPHDVQITNEAPNYSAIVHTECKVLIKRQVLLCFNITISLQRIHDNIVVNKGFRLKGFTIR